MTIAKQQIINWLERASGEFEQQKSFLTELDREIGDADHGLNMHRGFKKVLEKLPSLADKDIGTILKTTGMTLLSSIGGASGPLYGTFFIRAAGSVMAKETLSVAELEKMLSDGVAGIVQRGKAEAGDKTMIDAWLPALEALSNHSDAAPADALQQALQAAEQGVKDTITMQAKKGRASYLGERSIGHQDPGATSTQLLLKALHQSVSS